VLVHNCGGGAANPADMQARVDAMTTQMGAGAQYRTVGGLHVDTDGAGGLDLFAVGANSEITDRQAALADIGDEIMRRYPRPAPGTRDPDRHAEPKLLIEAVNLQVSPRLLIVSNDFCPTCRQLVNRLGGTIITPRIAIWPSRG